MEIEKKKRRMKLRLIRTKSRLRQRRVVVGRHLSPHVFVEHSEPTRHPSKEGHVIIPARQFNLRYEIDPDGEISTILSSVKKEEIPSIRRRFEIPPDIEIIISSPWQMMYNCPERCICIHLAASNLASRC